MRIQPGKGKQGCEYREEWLFIASLPGLKRLTAAPGRQQTTRPVPQEETSATKSHYRFKPRKGQGQRSKSQNASGNQQSIRNGAGKADPKQMLTTQPLAQDKSILRTNRKNKAEPEAKTGKQAGRQGCDNGHIRALSFWSRLVVLLLRSQPEDRL